MVTTVYRLPAAALAAGFLSLVLSACGGGNETPQTQAVALSALPFTNVIPAVESPQKRILAAAPVAPAPEKFTLSAVIVEQPLGGSTFKQALAAAPSTISAEELLAWAEPTFPEYFPSHVETLQGDYQGWKYTFRRYLVPGGVNFAAVREDGTVWGLGSYIGSNEVPHYFGTLEEFKCRVNVDLCRPKVVVLGVSPGNGALNVATNGVTITVPFDQPLVCPATSIVGTFGVITGTLSCVATATNSVITIKTLELPSDSFITASLSGFRNRDGYEMLPFTWSFTTEKKAVVPVIRILTANAFGYDTGAVSIIDPVTKVITKVALAKAPGYLWSNRVDPDGVRGVAYMGAQSTFVLHRVDPLSGTALASFAIDPGNPDLIHGIHGLAHSDTAVCIVTGQLGRQAQYYWRNRFICFDPVSGNKAHVSATDFLGDASMIPTQVLYSATRKKFYVFMATEAAIFLESFAGAGGGGRDGYRPGTTGTVVEIDAETYQKGCVWRAGSVPLDGEIDGNLLRVINGGDKSLSKIDLSASCATTVKTVDWATTFMDRANPTGIKIDLAQGVYYVPDWVDSVRVMSLATDQEVGRIVIGDVPWGMGIAAGSLWVAAPKKLVFDPFGDSVFEIDRTSRTIKSTITGVGALPWGLAIYDTTQ